MPDAIVPTSEAIDKLLGMLRGRLEEAFRHGQKVEAHARAGLKQQVWEPGKAVQAEEDGSFAFTLHIEKRKGDSTRPAPAGRNLPADRKPI